MEDIENNIRALGQKRDIVGLQKYVAKLSVDDLTSLVESRISNPIFGTIWNYIMQSFTDSSDSHRKRFKVATMMLKELEKRTVTSSQSKDIVARLCIELPKFQAQNLIELCNYCIECIQKGSVTEICWKEILPEILNVIVEIEYLKYNEIDMTGMEYKNQLINSLCMLVWSPNIVIPLTSMFIDMPLTKEEHLQVVNKLGTYMEKMTSREVPAFIFQLLKLCRYQNSRFIFLRLQHYFETRIYSRLDLGRNADSETMDIIEDATPKDTMEDESTVLFHILESASAGYKNIKDYLASLKNMTKSPEFILHPFQMGVLLTISRSPECQESVMEILKSSIGRAVLEEHKKKESCWLRQMIPKISRIEDVLLQVFQCCCISERYEALESLVQLAYVLLGINAGLSKESCLMAEKQWQLGKMILLKVPKKKRSSAFGIITSLGNSILTGQNVFQYIDCLNVLIQKMPLLMLENQSCFMTLIQNLVQIPGPAADQLFNAILPLTKVSPTIRDHLILILRKALYARNTATRQMAVSGFLKLIKSLKISNLAALSQSSSSSSMSSGPSLLTQVSLTCMGKATSANVFSNEALCLEVLSILRRSFMQQAEVRMQLYDGLYDAVCMNPELGIPVLDLIWIQLRDFYVMDEDKLPPLEFSKITVTKDLNVALQEPLGKLIYAVGLIVTKVREEYNANSTIIKFNNVLDSLCTRMINCELINLELDDGTDLLDVLPESQQKLLVLKEAISVYEALIGYKICSWGPQLQSNGQHINSLFQGYSRLVDFAKNLLKTKRGKKKSKNDTTQSSQNTTQADSGQKIKTFKFPKTVLDFQTVGKILHLLHENEVGWATTEEAIVIKTKPEFHRHIMGAAMQLVEKLKKFKMCDGPKEAKMFYNYMTEMAGILYERCIKQFNIFMDFDNATAVLALECFYLILSVICTRYSTQLSAFLSTVAGKSKDDELTTVLSLFVDTYKDLFTNDIMDGVNDVELKKLSLCTLNTLTLLVSQIPTEQNVLSNQFVEWTKTFMDDNSLTNKQLVSGFVQMSFGLQIKLKSNPAFFGCIALRLSEVVGAINEEKSDTNQPKIIDEASALAVIPLLCNTVKAMLDEIDWIVGRLRAEYGMIMYPGEDKPERCREYLKSKERQVCCQLCPIITVLGIMCNLTIPPGNLFEAILKNIAHLYNSLNFLAKYFILRTTKINLVFQGARFERVVQLAGKQLSTIVYNFILYMEESQKDDEKTQNKKKSVNGAMLKTKVLKETRLIPKAIFEIEQFGKSVIQLSNKSKVDLAKFVGQGSTRDFRIKGLKDVLEQMEETQNDDSIKIDTSIESETTMDVDEASSDQDGDKATDPPRKKKK